MSQRASVFPRREHSLSFLRPFISNPRTLSEPLLLSPVPYHPPRLPYRTTRWRPSARRTSCPSGCHCTRPSLTPTLPHASTVPLTPPLPSPYTCTIRYHNGVPMASHRGSRARTLCPPHQAVSVSESCARPSCGRARALEAGARRRVPRRGYGDRARPAAIGRPPRRPAQPSMGASNSCSCGAGERHAILSLPLQHVFQPPPCSWASFSCV